MRRRTLVEKMIFPDARIISWGTGVIDPTRGREVNMWPQMSGRTLVSQSLIMPQFNSHILVEEEKYRYGGCVILT